MPSQSQTSTYFPARSIKPLFCLVWLRCTLSISSIPCVYEDLYQQGLLKGPKITLFDRNRMLLLLRGFLQKLFQIN